MKKGINVVMAVSLSTAVLLSACQSKGDTKDAATPAPSDKAGTATAPTGIKLPLKETGHLKVLAARAALAPADFNQLDTAKKLEKSTNIHIDWDTIPDADWQQKRNLLIASGSLPDVIYGSDFTDNELVKYGKDGTILQLDDLINKDMPNVKALFQKRPDIKAAVTAPDGHIYALPVGQELGVGQKTIGSVPDFLYINQDWLDKLGLKMPTTIDELHDVLKTFKAKDPAGNGKTIPFAYADTMWTGDIGYLFGAFGVPDKTYQPGNNTFAEHLNVDNGKVSYAAVQDGYKKALQYFHQWFAEGLVDPDSFTYTKDAAKYIAKGTAKDDVFGAIMWWDHTDIVGKEKDKHYPLVPPFKDMVVKYNNGSSVGRGGPAITKSAKDPDVAAAWLDAMYEPHLTAEIQYGPIGVWFDQDANGKLVQKSNISNPGELRQKVQLGSKSAGFFTGDDFENISPPEPRAEQRMVDIKNLFIPQMQKENYPNIFFTEDELKTIEKLKTQIQTYTDSKRSKFLLNGLTDAQWDEFVATLNKMGLPDLMKVYQDGYDRYLAAQKK